MHSPTVIEFSCLTDTQTARADQKDLFHIRAFHLGRMNGAYKDAFSIS